MEALHAEQFVLLLLFVSLDFALILVIARFFLMFFALMFLLSVIGDGNVILYFSDLSFAFSFTLIAVSEHIRILNRVDQMDCSSILLKMISS